MIKNAFVENTVSFKEVQEYVIRLVLMQLQVIIRKYVGLNLNPMDAKLCLALIVI